MSKTKLRAERLDKLLQDSSISLAELREIKTELRQMGVRYKRVDREQIKEVGHESKDY